MRLRILHVSTRFTLGGAEKNMAHVITRELEDGHDVHFAFGRDSKTIEAPAGATLHVVSDLRRSIRPAADLRAWAALRRLIRKYDFDVVHTHESKAGVVGRAAARGSAAAIVHTIHMPAFGPGYGLVASRLYSSAERVCGSWTDEYLSVGEELIGLYVSRNISCPERYRVLRSPVEVQRFAACRSVTTAERAVLRTSFGLDAHRATIVTMGRLEPRKRPGLILDKLAPLIAAGRIQLAVAGEGPDRARLLSQAHRLGVASDVHVLGHIAEPERLLSTADALAHASRVEGVPQVVVQALAAGVPVVATEMEGLREIPGAPVAIVSRDGEHMSEAVERWLASPPPPVDVGVFHPWTTPSINETLAHFHSDLKRLVSSRRHALPRRG
jgi:glycosyltransferase involved in cell wall biosynthesis